MRHAGPAGPHGQPALIAVGAMLPGVGGMATRLGHTEVLYVTEFLPSGRGWLPESRL